MRLHYASFAVALIAACAGDDAHGDRIAPLLADHVVGSACAREADCAGDKPVCITLTKRRGRAGWVHAPGGYCTAFCSADGQCGLGGACIEGRCLAACSADDDCRSGYRCAEGTCESITDDIGLLVGANCTGDGDCVGGLCLHALGELDAPNGYCSGRCLFEDDCGGVGVCKREPGAEVGLCVERGKDDAWCARRRGNRWRTWGEESVCVPGSPMLGNYQAGRACSHDWDCRADGGEGLCLSELDGVPAPGGYCSQRCVQDIDCGFWGGICRGGEGGVVESGTCYGRCSLASDCREGYACEDGVCVPST